MNFIMHQYIAKYFLQYLLLIFFSISSIILFFDILELTRLSLKISDLTFSKIIFMGVMKNYYHANKTWPFIIVLTVALTYRKLSESFELYILRASGFSTFQLLLPIIIISFAIGIIHITILNPIGSYCIEKYQHLEAINLKGRKSLISFSESGLWLKQNEQENKYIIFHALRLSQLERSFYDVTFFYYDYNHTFIKRVDAKKVSIFNNEWIINDVQIIDAKYNFSYEKQYKIPTDLTFDSIIESIISPEILSFWQLYNFIKVIEVNGLIAIKQQLYFWQLFFSPLLFAATALIGYIFGIRKPREIKSYNMIIIAILIQLVIFFISDFLVALALSCTIPIIIGALFPFIITIIIGLYSILHFEFS